MFLDKVSKFPRLINIGSMALATKQSPTSAASMHIGVTATAFVFTETELPATPATPAPKAPGAK